MKLLKLFIPFLFLTLIVSCQQEEISSGERTLTPEEAINLRTPPDKIIVCHLNEAGEYEVREVPLPSLNGHLSHGDFLPDNDNDGYSSIPACIGTKDDCNDFDASIHPGAQEICNGVDDDCDGLTDDEDTNVEGGTWYFRDDDQDGHGSIADGNKFCVQPEGWVTNISDCDDDDPTIHNDAVDIPDDGIDQNCDGQDETNLQCQCFTMQQLQDFFDYTWVWGWYNLIDANCQPNPLYQGLNDIVLIDAQKNGQVYNTGAGTIAYPNGTYNISFNRFNKTTNQTEENCYWFVPYEEYLPCKLLMDQFLAQVQVSHPDWDYCVRFP